MNIPYAIGDRELRGRKMLLALPPPRKNPTALVVGLLEAAKARWNFEFDVVCAHQDKQALTKLVSDSGQFFLRPHLLRRAAWESDPIEVAATKARLRDAERAAKLPVGRAIMGAAHTLGRAHIAAVRIVRPYPLVREILQNNDQAFDIFLRLFRYAEEVLAESRPDIVCAHEYVTPINAALWFSATLREVPCLAFRYSKISSGRGFWTFDRIMLNTLAYDLSSANIRAKVPASNRAHSALEKFRNRPATVNYIADKWRMRSERGFISWHILNARVVVRELVDRLKGKDAALFEPPISRFARYYRARFMTVSQRRYLRRLSESELANMKYIYFPLHKEGELALTLQATQWHNQRNTIRLLASMLPFGYRLVVRDNILNSGNCPTRIYRDLSRIPNVVLIDPVDTQFKYLRHANLIVTENGSSGWEGLAFGRRVFVLADTFYDGAGLGLKVTDPVRLNAALLELLAGPAIGDEAARNHALASMIDADLQTTFVLSADGQATALERLSGILCSKDCERTKDAVKQRAS